MPVDSIPAPASLPRHVAIIMDGNGRWAEERGLPRTDGHKQGANSVREVVRGAREIGLRALTLYAFSSQNWARPPEEVRTLMQLLHDYLIEERAEIMDNGIRLRAVGDIGRLPDFVREPLHALERDSAHHTQMVLCLALSYGGRESILEAVGKIASAARRGEIEPGAISEELFSATLQTSFLPPLDLLIRTSGEERISNFLLWEAAYAEMYFTEVLWPEFGKKDLRDALASYARRERRFGLTAAQVKSAS